MASSSITFTQLIEKIEMLPLVDVPSKEKIIDEFVKNKYFENCKFESNIEIMVFHLLNYALTTQHLMNENLIELFKQLFSHSDHCYFIKGPAEHCCKINSRLYRLDWLKVFFETVCKLHSYNFVLMNEHLIAFMEILFQKTSNRHSINTNFVPILNFLIRNTQNDLEPKDKIRKISISIRKKQRVVLLFILILDGQYQCYLNKKIIQEAGKFLDSSSIRMHWEAFDKSDDIDSRVKSIFEFCKTLVETHNDLNQIVHK